jgi:large subunit ribosomal protein L16
MPRKEKFRKQHRGRMKGKARRGCWLELGEFGLQALEPCWLTARQIESARVAITRAARRGGKVWIRVFPDKPVTKKPAETRGGGGKGPPEYHIAVIRPGRILFEIGGVPRDVAHDALKRAQYKLPLKCRVLSREGAA